MDFFYSDDPQEIEDEKKRQECYRQYLPQLMGEKDETKYILVRHNKNEDFADSINNKPKDQKSNGIKNLYNKAKVLVKEASFAFSNPLATIDIGAGVKSDASNISSNAARFAKRDKILSNTLTADNIIDEGSEKGAMRHTLWQANIASKYGDRIAAWAGNAHEISPGIDLSIRRFNHIENADQTADLLNNQIGRAIGGINKNKTAKELAFIVLDEFRNNGLYVSEQDKDGFWNVRKRKLSEEQYNKLKQVYNTLNEDGFTKEEITKINNKEKEEEKKRMEFSEIAKNWRTKK